MPVLSSVCRNVEFCDINHQKWLFSFPHSEINKQSPYTSYNCPILFYTRQNTRAQTRYVFIQFLNTLSIGCVRRHSRQKNKRFLDLIEQTYSYLSTPSETNFLNVTCWIGPRLALLGSHPRLKILLPSTTSIDTAAGAVDHHSLANAENLHSLQ